eukprot:scaffold330_cov109-Isochrysis_galbana.AAC.16
MSTSTCEAPSLLVPMNYELLVCTICIHCLACLELNWSVPEKAPATLVQRATAWLEERGGCARADLRTPTL